jgi:transcriptional regulator with XRE-family HTH domain
MNTITTLTTLSQPRWEAQALRAGSTLKRNRLALGLSQAELATQAGLARADYSQVEAGRWPSTLAPSAVVGMLAAAEHALWLAGSAKRLAA